MSNEEILVLGLVGYGVFRLLATPTADEIDGSDSSRALQPEVDGDASYWSPTSRRSSPVVDGNAAYWSPTSVVAPNPPQYVETYGR